MTADREPVLADAVRYVSWECFVAEHQDCAGSAWDEEHDQSTPCGCRCHVKALRRGSLP